MGNIKQKPILPQPTNPKRAWSKPALKRLVQALEAKPFAEPAPDEAALAKQHQGQLTPTLPA